jgi:hypothetical protein
MSLAALREKAAEHFLADFGTLAPSPQDGIDNGNLVLLGPAEPGFWNHVTAQSEFIDGQPDPLDRWSRRVIDALAMAVGGTAFFPFDKPYHPFFTWAVNSGRAWKSPVQLLVHDSAGLMVSYRGAVLLPEELSPQPKRPSPCTICKDKPCLTACPPRALTGEGYDLVACHAYLDTDAGSTNLSRGCAVRRACPISKNYGRSEEQSAFHMKQFHK